MLFKLPDPPPGQTYVTRQTANGPTTILVPTSSLGEDICSATGRTWEEEARLYNINNAPDGKKIAEPGDRFYQTAESMKNKNKQINGIVSAGSLKFFDLLKGTAPDNPPNLSETIDKIKSGSINADITANLGKIGEVSGSLPGVSNAQLEAAKADIAAKMAQAQKDLPKLMAMAQSNVDILTKKKIAETGKPPTEAEIKAAQGALTIFQDGPKLLEEKAAEISKAVAESGKDFGANLSKGLSSAKDFAKAGINKVTDLAKIAGAKITEFANGVPSQTIPDPANPGQTIPNPAYATFAADPANALKIAKVTEVTGKMNTAAADMTTKFAAIEAKQASAATTTMADLKAFGFAAKLSQPATGLAATIQGFALDPKAFDPASISKTFSQVSKLGASINTARYKDTKDADLTYKGDDGIVWDSVDTERQRRGLPGLAAIGSPRPLDPPLVPAGPTPPKDPLTTVKETKPPIIAEEKSTQTTTVKKRAVFDKDLNEKITNPFVKQYNVVWEVYNKRLEELRAEANKVLVSDWYKDTDIVDYISLRDKKQKIEKDKPQASDRTPEENLIIKQQKFYRELFIEYSPVSVETKWVSSRTNEISRGYNILREAFLASKTFGDLPTSVEEAVMKDGGPKQWKKFVTEYYNSFAEFAKANPDKITPPTA